MNTSTHSKYSMFHKHSNSILRHLAAWTCVSVLLSPLALPAQITHTWLGNEFVDLWSSAANWSTNTTPANGDSLIFDGPYTASYNDLLFQVSLREITFASTAGDAFVVSGNLFSIGGTITNHSNDLVEIQNDLHIVNAGSPIPNSYTIGAWPNGSTGLLIDVGHAGMTLSGNITRDANERVLVKTGSGVLTMTGNMQLGRGVAIDRGDLVLSGGTWSNSGDNTHHLVLGSGWNANAPEQFASSRLILKDNATVNRFSNIRLRAWSGANSIVVEDGSAFTFTPTFHNNGSQWPSDVGGAGNNAGYSSLNIDLSDGGEAFTTSGSGTLLHPWLTVSTTVSGEKKTGFAYINSLSLTHATPFLSALPTNATVDNTFYKTSGHVSVTPSNAALFLHNSTLTITPTGDSDPSGSLTSSSGYIRGWGLLMEEGTGNYTINSNIQTSGLVNAGHRYYIHQYSVDGTLTLAGSFVNFQAVTNTAIIKTGPGMVQMQGSSEHQLLTEIQGGHFILNGQFGSNEYFHVRGADAVLSGSGIIGGTAISGNPRYAQVRIFEGGTLQGDHHLAKALEITGSLTFQEESNYQMALHDDPQYQALTVKSVTTGSNPQDALVVLAGNLELTLHYDFDVETAEPIILLRTDGTITDGFDTINGQSFINGNQFLLTYNSNQYWFEIDYAYDLGSGWSAIALYAIPEPSTVALFFGVVLSGLVYLRRKKS